MKRCIALLCLSLGLGCGNAAQVLDAGVDAGVPDAAAVEQIPPKPSLTSRVYDRAGRPFVAGLLLATSATAASARDAVRVAYNEVEPQRFTQLGTPLNQGTDDNPTAARYVLPDLGLYDALDGVCGQGNLTVRASRPEQQYGDLARVLADDRIWLDTSAEGPCDTLLAVERRAFGLDAPPADDCGGRAPHVDALDPMLGLITSTTAGDGVDADAAPLSEFEPFFDLP